MQTEPKYYAQGDCLLFEGAIPKTAKAVKTDVLVASQVTSHKHRVKGARVLKDGDTLYVRAPKTFELVHEEHKTLKIPAGSYRMQQVREYDHIAEEARAVAD